MLPRFPPGSDDPIRNAPAALFEQHEGGGLLAFDAIRVDRVDDRDALRIERAHRDERGIEVAVDRDDRGAVIQRLRDLRFADPGRRHEHDRVHSGARGIGGQRSRRVAGARADRDARAGRRAREIATVMPGVFERRRRIHAEMQVREPADAGVRARCAAHRRAARRPRAASRSHRTESAATARDSARRRCDRADRSSCGAQRTRSRSRSAPRAAPRTSRKRAIRRTNAQNIASPGGRAAALAADEVHAVVTAPSDAEPTRRAYFAITLLSVVARRGLFHAARRCGDLPPESLRSRRRLLDVDRDRVAVAHGRDRAAGKRFRRDVADHQSARRAAEAAVGDQRDGLAEALADDRGGDAEHLAHARTAFRAFVANHDDVAVDDLAPVDRCIASSSRSNTRARPRDAATARVRRP